MTTILRELKQWLKQRCKPPADTNDDKGAGPERDDEATVEGIGRFRLPTYRVKRNYYYDARDISDTPAPMMVLGILQKIYEDFNEARMILFAIAQRNTSLLNRRSRGLKLSGAARDLDKALCKAAKDMTKYVDVGYQFYDDKDHKKMSRNFANDQQVKDALETTDSTLRRVEKTIRDRIVDTLNMGMIHKEQDIDYDPLLTQTELNKKEAQDACENFHGVIKDVLRRMRRDYNLAHGIEFRESDEPREYDESSESDESE
ncbi:hypothetical protein PG997_005708 [Apiospora hydei]|uniref:Uncharacterized protein n=1 Tax=Apiospora hydei TaxID=1337664 RepID=A0ABR1WLQ7_9PEZI